MSRSATSASPSGRNAIPHGTDSPVATVRRAGTWVAVGVGSGVSFGVADAGGDRRRRGRRRLLAMTRTPTSSSAASGSRAADHAGGGRCAGSLTTVTKNSSIWRTTSMKRLKSTGLVTYAFACRS